MRVNSSKNASKDNLSDSADYCLVPPMSTPRCAVGTAELGGKLFVCGRCCFVLSIFDAILSSYLNRWLRSGRMSEDCGSL